jgi:hypothetical protein
MLTNAHKCTHGGSVARSWPAEDPTNANLVIVGGIDLWRSVDGGNSLVDISTWWDARSAHSDHHAIVSDPAFDGTSNKTVFFGNDGGVYKTADISSVGNNPLPPRNNGWTKLSSTYGVTQFYSGAGNVSTGKARADEQEPDKRHTAPGELATDNEAHIHQGRWL